jgi:outer membrane protein
MKRIPGVIMAVALGLALSAGVCRAADERVVFIDLDRIFNEFYKTKLADTQLKEQADEFSEERGKLMTDYQKMQEDFKAAKEATQNTALNEAALNKKRDEAEEKLVALQEHEAKVRRFDESRRKQLDDQSRRMRKRIVDEIRIVIQDFARTQGYVAVIDSSGQSLNGVESILYVDPRVDITDGIIGLLNKGSSETKTEEVKPDKSMEVKPDKSTTEPATKE